MTLTTRLAIAMIMLVAVAVSAVGWLSYRALEQALLPRILDRLETNGNLIVNDLQAYMHGARADVTNFIARGSVRGMVTARFNGGIDPVDHISEDAWRARLATRLVAELKAKPSYAQFRLIGIADDGREMLRVDRSGPNGAIRIVPDFELQQKGDR
ncbi:MAG: hybrid sensor histidine kinase/response regulator, partial [Candidatus Eremiobacteraeota bacterium]|nr:hybrid sensor histidine kinase/response regulator [Candidatus Eremiobacteraeota bacterium]